MNNTGRQQQHTAGGESEVCVTVAGGREREQVRVREPEREGEYCLFKNTLRSHSV